MNKKYLFSGVLALFIWGMAAWACAATGEPLRIAVSAPYPPFADYDAEGELVGFNVDISRALCEELDRNCTITSLPFNKLLPAIVAGEVDMAVAGIGVNEERSAQVDFTERYFRSLSIFIEKQGKVGALERSKLKGLRIGVQAGTLQESYLRENHGKRNTIIVLPSFNGVLEMLKEDKLDLALVDGLPGYAYLKSPLGQGFEAIGVPVETEGVASWSCIAVSKRLPELREDINKAIKSLRWSGKYDKINRKYFDFDIY